MHRCLVLFLFLNIEGNFIFLPKLVNGERSERMSTVYSNTSRSGLAYTNEEEVFLDNLAKVISDREEMEKISPYIAAGFQRTIGGIQKQIEERKGWYYR